MKISQKLMITKKDGWYYRLEPIYAICGVNDTGSDFDSPCPSELASKELDLVKKILRKNKIRYITKSVPTMNIFCIKRFIIVSEEDKYKALRLIDHLRSETRLLYFCWRSHSYDSFEDDLPF
jgi:hypothetical protein